MTDNAPILDPMDYRTELNVFPILCPFDYRSFCPYDLICIIRDLFDQRRSTKQSFTIADLMEEYDDTRFNALSLNAKQIVLAAAGSWQLSDEYNSYHTKFVNPNYYHLHTMTDLGDSAPVDDLHQKREEWIRTARRLQWGLDRIGIRMGYTASDVQEYADDRGIDLQQLLDDGITTLARTWKLAREWGTPIDQIGTAFDIHPDVIDRLIAYEARGFEPPEDPSGRLSNYSS